MRGEKPVWHTKTACLRGSPPLARGKDDLFYFVQLHSGITPACAGKSHVLDRSQRFNRDHPRLRGEKRLTAMSNLLILGSPPLARGKDDSNLATLRQIGITPACAGKSLLVFTKSIFNRDHPRLRGEKYTTKPKHRRRRGSPPLARGKVFSRAALVSVPGITPACAGKRLKKSKNTYDPKCPISAFHSVFQTQQMSGDNPQAHDAMQKRPFRSGMRVSSIYNPKQCQVFFLPIEAYQHMGF